MKKTQLLISTMKGLAKFSMFNVHPASCSQDSGRLGKIIDLWQVLYFQMDDLTTINHHNALSPRSARSRNGMHSMVRCWQNMLQSSSKCSSAAVGGSYAILNEQIDQQFVGDVKEPCPACRESRLTKEASCGEGTTGQPGDHGQVQMWLSCLGL